MPYSNGPSLHIPSTIVVRRLHFHYISEHPNLCPTLSRQVPARRILRTIQQPTLLSLRSFASKTSKTTVSIFDSNPICCTQQRLPVFLLNSLPSGKGPKILERLSISSATKLETIPTSHIIHPLFSSVDFLGKKAVSSWCFLYTSHKLSNEYKVHVPIGHAKYLLPLVVVQLLYNLFHHFIPLVLQQ
jgi:hypothetical protein